MSFQPAIDHRLGVPSDRIPKELQGSASGARERLTEGLLRDDPTAALKEMVVDGFFARWVPEIVDMQLEQDPVHRHKDVLAHTIAVTASTPAHLRLRYAALMHDIGKPATHRVGPTGVTFRHHEAVGARITRRRLTEMGFDPEFVTEVATLVELSGRFKGFSDDWTDSAIRRYVVDAGALLGDLNLLVRHDCTTRHVHKVVALQASVDELERRIRVLAAADSDARRRPPLRGEEIMAILGVPAGPIVGAAITMLLSLDPSTERDEAERRLRSWWDQRAATA